MTWRDDCDDCGVATADRRLLEAYLTGGPPSKERAERMGLELLPCKMHSGRDE